MRVLNGLDDQLWYRHPLDECDVAYLGAYPHDYVLQVDLPEQLVLARLLYLVAHGIGDEVLS